jgi:hypothetical protein
VLQQRKLHVLEKEMRQRKLLQEQLLHDEEDVEPQPKVVLVKDDALAEQRKDAPVVQREDALVALNANEVHLEEDVDKTSKPFYFFLLKPLV